MKNEIIVSLCIWRFEDKSPDELTEIIGITPSMTFRKGEKQNELSSIISKENAWILNSSKGKYATFEVQMNDLIDQISSRMEVFKAIAQTYYCEFSCALYVYPNNNESVPWIHLDNNYNKLIKELNIEFDLDLIILPCNKARDLAI